MRITPELIAKLIYSASELRYFEREIVMEPNNELQDICIRCQCRLDSVLSEMGVDQYLPLKTLIETIKLNEYEKV